MKTINFKVIFNLIGMLMLINAIFMLVCVIVSLIYWENTYLPLLISTILTALFGSLAYFGTRNAQKK